MTRTSFVLALFVLAGIQSTVTSFSCVRVGLNRWNDAATVGRLSLGASQAPTPSSSQPSPPVLCELQTFLKLCNLVQSGGEAKFAIQDGQCSLNGEVETRRAKKLFEGDVVAFGGSTLDVRDEVNDRGYVYKIKARRLKPVARVDADGNLEFGGRYRSEEWRAQRKQKKTERKTKNKESK